MGHRCRKIFLLARKSGQISNFGRNDLRNSENFTKFRFKSRNFIEYFAKFDKKLANYCIFAQYFQYFGWKLKISVAKIFVNCRNPAAIQLFCSGGVGCCTLYITGAVVPVSRFNFVYEL